MIIVSCGFDACYLDPLGAYDLSPDFYGTMTRYLKAETPKLMLVLEGGYNTKQVPLCMEACVRALLG